MLSSMEKKQLLRTVELFTETSDEILGEVVQLLEEVAYPTGTTLIQQGDPGDAMYILTDGRVRIHSGGRTLAVLTAGGVFGEMAALDPEPRSASITAVTHVHLLRLAREPFHELIISHPDMTLGIIHMLCQTLRARTTSMVEDYQYIQQVSQLTAAAAKVEAGIYQPESVDSVAHRDDALGQLARVFQRMIRQVDTREQNLQQQVQDLRIEVDQVRQNQQVEQITSTEYFQQLSQKAKRLRHRFKGDQ